VSAQIIPWNYPLEMTARSLSPALATGNACVIKSPELDPLTNAWFARAAEAAGLPRGRSTSSAVGARGGRGARRASGINQIVFTGSVPTGIAIAQAAARRTWCLACWSWAANRRPSSMTTPISMRSRMTIRWGIYFNAGQVCSAMSRVIVHESRATELVDAGRTGRQVPVGGPGIERANSGQTWARWSPRPARPCRAWSQPQARARGVVTGGGPRLNRPGHFMEPTVWPVSAPTWRSRSGGLRPGPVGPDLPRRRGGHRDRQRHRLRPGRWRLHPPIWTAPPAPPPAARRAGLRQRMVCRRCRDAVWRLWQVRLRSGEGARGALELRADQERRDQDGGTSAWQTHLTKTCSSRDWNSARRRWARSMWTEEPRGRRRFHPAVSGGHDSLVLGLRLGRRRDRPQDALDDEPRHDRRARQDARVGNPLPRRAEQRRQHARKSAPSSTWSASIAACRRRWSVSAWPARCWLRIIG
jgi:hypothetical protein